MLAPAGTVTVSEVADAAVTAAATVLNDTVFCAAVALNPVPAIVRWFQPVPPSAQPEA